MIETSARVENLLITQEMQDSYLTYAMSVIMARALPDVRDGLKPSQRRILAAMNDLNLGPTAKPRKCAKIAGDTSGNYHPHGEGAIYPTLVRLAQPFNMRYPLIQGQGNFGSIDGDPPAAMRYTEARMTTAATELLRDLNLETVDFERNYDDTRDEPSVLPGRLPNLLVNGSTGIAVGMATNMPPHNLGEVCAAIIAYLDNPQISLEELMEHLPGPDFPTGGMICGRSAIREAYRTGRGSIVVRGRLHVEEGRAGKKWIIIDQIPYQVLKSTLRERIAACVRSGQIHGIVHMNDASGRQHALRLELELRKEANEDVIINQLYQYTPLQNNFPIMNVALVNRQPLTLGIKQLIECFVEHRQEVISRRTAYKLRRARQRAHILEALILAVGAIDEVVALIKGSANPDAAKQALMAKPLRLVGPAALLRLLPEPFTTHAAEHDQFLTAAQAQAILALQLARLTGLEIEKLATEYAGLIEEITGYERILADERLIIGIIGEELGELKQRFADPRRTEITAAVGEFSMEELIPEEQVVVTLSHQGYVKRVPVEAYRKQGRGGKGLRAGELREGDFLQRVFVASTHEYLLVFTNRGRVYWLRVYDLPSMQRTSRGRSIANLLNLQPNEEPRAVLPVSRFQENYLFFATAKGIVKKTPLAAFSRPRPSGIIAMLLDPDDQLIGVEITHGGDEVVLGTRAGYAIRFYETEVRSMGRSARGVHGIALRRDDRVVDMVVIQPGLSLLTLCENGYGKRTDIAEYRLTRRGGKGIINIRITERNGPVVALRPVSDADELMIITASGQSLRTGLEAVRQIGRATQGVRLMRLEAGDKIAAAGRIAAEEVSNQGNDSPPQPPPEAPSTTDEN